MLSEYLERDITQENLVDIKQQVQDKYRYCDSRRRVLAEHVYEGYDKDWWEYSDDTYNGPPPQRSDLAEFRK